MEKILTKATHEHEQPVLRAINRAAHTLLLAGTRHLNPLMLSLAGSRHLPMLAVIHHTLVYWPGITGSGPGARRSPRRPRW